MTNPTPAPIPNRQSASPRMGSFFQKRTMCGAHNAGRARSEFVLSALIGVHLRPAMFWAPPVTLC
jgi:hypothetical protein